MFFEASNIIEASKCLVRLDDPRMLPCGDTICSLCQSTIHVSNKQFKCVLCKKTHSMPDEGLPVNKMALNFLLLQPTEVYRGPYVALLSKELKKMQTNITSLSFGINSGIDKIKEECIELRNQTQLATEQAIELINEFSDELIAEIDQFERSAIKSYQSNEVNSDEAIKTVQELEQFHSEWSKYLNKANISHENILKANSEAAKLNKKANEEAVNLDSLVFKDGLLKYTKNSNKLEKTLLGSLELKSILGIESTILSLQQMKQLITLCNFPFNQKWRLLYRATQDGFCSLDFHSKCDKQQNTFFIVKSTNGNVFGGYTEQEWSGEWVDKSDATAFIFSFINQENKPLVMRNNNSGKAIYCSSIRGPVFGEDFYIYSNSHKNNYSYSEISHCYTHPQYASGSNEAKSFLAGSYNFSTTEIEVFTKE